MTEVIQQQKSTWKSEAIPQSFWNIPQAAKTSQSLSDNFTALGMAASVATPTIEQLYNPADVKFLPGKGSKGKGEFVDWGTKLYQLELELSYKNNEIVVLQKKLKKYTDELYPRGNTAKKSVVSYLQDQCDVTNRKLETKEKQLKFEQKRSRGLEHELSAVKKQNLQMRRQNLVNDKAVQTLPDNNKETQLSVSPKKRPTRTVMTQCTPTVIKVSSSTRVTSQEPKAAKVVEGRGVVKKRVHQRAGNISSSGRYGHSSTSSFTSSSASGSYSSISNVALRTEVNAAQKNIGSRSFTKNVTVENRVKVDVVPDEMANKIVHDNSMTSSSSGIVVTSPVKPKFNNFTHAKPGVKFATSMMIKEDEERAKKTKQPLEMSITQEFGKEQVKTVVQSNRDFNITERPVMMPPNSNFTQPPQYSSIAPQSQTDFRLLKPNSYNTDGDSGMSSYETSDGGSPTNFRTFGMEIHSPRTTKLSYKQILDGTSPAVSDMEGSNGRVYERHVQEYMKPAYPASIHPSPPPPRNFSPVMSSTKIVTSTQSYLTPREIYERNTVTNGPGAMIPYYLFRRTDLERKRSQEKPIFVHVSEITMKR